MNCKKPRTMSLAEYKKWIKKPVARKASLPKFFSSGVQRTKNILKKKATQKSIKKRQAFLARHFSAYCLRPTEKRRIAIRNWGFALTKKRGEKQNA